jgi:hypothetical protein
MPGALLGGRRDHHQQPGRPGHQGGEQHDEGGEIEGFHQFDRKPQNPAFPLDGVDQDPPFGLAVDEALRLVQFRGHHLPAMNQKELIPFQQTGLLRRAVGQDLLDQHPMVLDLPGALVIG